MIRFSGLSVSLDYTSSSLEALLRKKLSLSSAELISWRLVRKSVDARKKTDVHFVLTVDLEVRNETSLLKKYRFLSPAPVSLPEPQLTAHFNVPPLVVGAGPAGLFAALTLARAGARPILIERGKPVEKRVSDIEKMKKDGILTPDSNIQFGEGGAGAFSDGKLTCGVKSPLLPIVLSTFVSHGAPEEILYDAKPHIGTDLLRGVVASMRREIQALGGTVLFETRLDGLKIENKAIRGAILTKDHITRELTTDSVLLCIGHSARDTMRMLYQLGIQMTQKPFAVGVRIEHPRSFIDQSQYGSFAGHPALGAASYQLTCHTSDGRGVYTFCMCPGGYVIPAASQSGGVVTNGMSCHARDADNSNAALLVGVRPGDYGSDHPLSGFQFQQEIEEKAYLAGGGAFRAPAQRVEDFLQNQPTKRFGDVTPSYLPGVTPSDLCAVFPSFITDNLRIGIRAMNQQLHGFAMPDAVLTGPETRSSSPVRLPRNEFYESVSLSGLFPVGEGAGYAGGIVSAAMDGIAAAQKLLARHGAVSEGR